MNWGVPHMFISEKPGPRSLLSAGRHLFWPNSETSERRDLQYGPQKRHRMDVYEPAEINEETETILFLHGGGWEVGSKDIHKFVGRSWARKNFIVALPNYRLAPEATYPDQMVDVANSATWILENYDGFTGSLYLAGHSAGAHLAALLGFSDSWREQANLRLEQIRGFILLAGVYQFHPFEEADPRIRRFMGTKVHWEEAQPYNHLKEGLPPVFSVHGREDSEVSPEQSIQLSQKLTELGVSNQLMLEDHVGHLELLFETAMKEVRFWISLQDFFG
ncbi:MAG: alpha/beta hydrolase [Candidatus Acetothermia bacterium]